MVKDYDDAEDLSQEVFIEVYLKLNKFREESSIGTWIYRIAVNKSLQFLRKRKAKKREVIEVEYSDQLSNAIDFDHPGVSLENKELARVLFHALDTLPEMQRVAFTLHKVEFLSQQEISEIMDKSVSAIESLIHRAKANLKTYLTTYYEQHQ